MKQADEQKANKQSAMRTEYDFSDGVRGKHHRAYQQGTNLVLLEPDVAKLFKDSAAVNSALKRLAEIAPDYVATL